MEGLESTDFTVKFLFAIDILNEKGIPNTAIERTLKVGRNKITNIRRGRSSADLALYSLLVKLYPEVETFTFKPDTTMQANAMTNTAFLNNTQRLIETQHELIEQQKKRIQELEKKLEMQETNKKHPKGGGGNY